MLDFFRVIPKSRNVKIIGKSGVIYYNPTRLKRLIFYVGNCLLVSSMIFLVYLYFPLGKALINYWNYKNNHIFVSRISPKPTPTDKIIISPTAGAETTITPEPLPTILITPTPTIVDNDYWIEIPKIGAKADVISGVSPFNEKEYKKTLENNKVAQAEGSFFPGSGIGRSTYIFAHSTEQGVNMIRKNSIFYLLGELQDNDEVIIKYQGKIRRYVVYKQLIAEADEIQYLEYSEPDREVLILQTCWPIGTAWKRLLVFAYPENV